MCCEIKILVPILLSIVLQMILFGPESFLPYLIKFLYCTSLCNTPLTFRVIYKSPVIAIPIWK